MHGSGEQEAALSIDPTADPRRDYLNDQRLLHRLGYAQELFRSMGGFQNFAISFTIISILAGCLTSYYIAYNQGGPVAITWGWLVVGLFSTIVAMAMGEIASVYPTAGGLYYWASKLGSPGWGWFTGWFNLIGQIAVTAAIGYGCAVFTTALLNLLWDYPNSTSWVLFTYGMILVLAGLVNMFKVSVTAMLNAFSAWWHMVGVLVIVGILIVVPDNHKSVGYVFGETINNTGFSGQSWSSFMFIYVFITGLIMAQYTITGFRRLCAHERGDEEGVARRSLGHGDGGRRVGDLRVHPPRRRDVRDPGREQRRSRRRGTGDRHAHLDGIDEYALGGIHALHRRGRADVLHDRLGDVGLADDVRVLA